MLVVEDDVAIREALSEALYHAGFEVHGALDGDDAISVIGADLRKWVVLLDLNLPRVDGWTFLDAIQALNVSEKQLRVLVLSANPRADELRDRKYVDGVMNKPVDMNSVVTALKAIAGKM